MNVQKIILLILLVSKLQASQVSNIISVVPIYIDGIGLIFVHVLVPVQSVSQSAILPEPIHTKKTPQNSDNSYAWQGLLCVSSQSIKDFYEGRSTPAAIADFDQNLLQNEIKMIQEGYRKQYKV